MPFDINSRGNIDLTPLVEYEPAVIADVSGAIRLVLARPSDPLGTGSLIVQMGISVAQAEELARDLRKIVDHIAKARANTRAQ